MFHFAIGRHIPVDTSGLPITEDREYGNRVFASWLEQTQNRIDHDLYPLSGHAVMRWDGPTPRDFDTCRRVVADALKAEPDYVWIDGRVRSYRASAVWDFSN